VNLELNQSWQSLKKLRIRALQNDITTNEKTKFPLPAKYTYRDVFSLFPIPDPVWPWMSRGCK
jgi:hypothetical protein